MGLNERGGNIIHGQKANLEAFSLWHNNKSYKVQDKKILPKMEYIPPLNLIKSSLLCMHPFCFPPSLGPLPNNQMR